ncbi:hypothetical protein [Halobacteriovorax sp. JY17]|uniref:hypothetical protein n=1 Tax=Halobacteriovorax sp. JY17 TaxID=2014617 RepID=UPI000C4E67B9|nr:hypothetical protein [Halobacteriovorax sp. JY17]PIK15251.1 MAG: hypothetical protein CES88_00650 [Halobacteriovorax sp. JY17]
MKKTTLIIVSAFAISAAAFAASPLVEEYKRRRSVVHTEQMKEAYEFMKKFDRLPENITELEVFGRTGKFIAKSKNDEVCFGDILTVSLECYNSIGYRTFFEAGDSD